MQLRTAGPRIPANDLELPQHPSLLQRPRQSLLQRAKAAKAVAKVEGKEESFEKLKKVKSLVRLRSLKNQKLSRRVETRLLW
jgi:hypothetical protein